MANAVCRVSGSDSISLMLHAAPPVHPQSRPSCATFVESTSGGAKRSLTRSERERKRHPGSATQHQVVCSHSKGLGNRCSDVFGASDSWFNDSRSRSTTATTLNNTQRDALGAKVAWQVMKNGVFYLDYRARRDVLVIKSAHDKAVEALNPTASEGGSIQAMREKLQNLRGQINQAHERAHISEARVQHTLQRLAELEGIVNRKSGNVSITQKPMESSASTPSSIASVETDDKVKDQGKFRLSKSRLDISGPPEPFPETLKNFWFPVAFSRDVDESTLIPFDCFEEPWVVFRGANGLPGCIRDACAHRSCPLSLGTIVEGKVQCPYHGWEFSTKGHCTKMPSTKPSNVKVKDIPCVEHEGMIWVWPGQEIPDSSLPSLLPPDNYTIHAEITLELPVEHGLLVENLLDLAHAPFTHTTTFAKGWEVPSLVRFKNLASSALKGNWDPYPIDMEFRPPCMVLSTIGLAKPGKLEGKNAAQCKTHLFQMHSCLPSSKGKTRLLYRMALDFGDWIKFVPFIDNLWKRLADQVLSEDLRLVLGQQDRMHRGANVWNHPVPYDKLGVGYRRWRRAVEEDGDRS